MRNTEMALIADVDLELLKPSLSRGAPRNFSQRRED